MKLVGFLIRTDNESDSYSKFFIRAPDSRLVQILSRIRILRTEAHLLLVSAGSPMLLARSRRHRAPISRTASVMRDSELGTRQQRLYPTSTPKINLLQSSRASCRAPQVHRGKILSKRPSVERFRKQHSAALASMRQRNTPCTTRKAPGQWNRIAQRRLRLCHPMFKPNGTRHSRPSPHCRPIRGLKVARELFASQMALFTHLTRLCQFSSHLLHHQAPCSSNVQPAFLSSRHSMSHLRPHQRHHLIQ